VEAGKNLHGLVKGVTEEQSLGEGFLMPLPYGKGGGLAPDNHTLVTLPEMDTALFHRDSLRRWKEMT